MPEKLSDLAEFLGCINWINWQEWNRAQILAQAYMADFFFLKSNFSNKSNSQRQLLYFAKQKISFHLLYFDVQLW